MHQISSGKKMEAMRDEVIVDNLGRDYELIRISTENLYGEYQSECYKADESS